MLHALKSWRLIRKRITKKKILLFLDFDGTLAPIASTPAAARISRRTSKLLQKLKATRRIKLAVISGRELHDVVEKVDLRGIYYAGNHGLQIEGPRLQWHYRIPALLRRRLSELRRLLLVSFKDRKGVLIEGKMDCVAVHYRNVPGNAISKFCTVLKRAASSFLGSGVIRMSKGKKVVEFSPAIQWDKGRAVLWLISRLAGNGADGSYIGIYVGDDYTDESAFRILRNKGITIRVGIGRKTRAEYYLKNTDETYLFLKQILTLTAGYK